jgi:type IV pilus assembly protein PilM
MASKITALYIDDTSIRVIVARGKRIIKLGEAPLDFPLSEANIAEREDEITFRIKQLFKTQKIKTKKIIVGISGLHCLSRPVVLPQLPKTMIEEAIIREAKRVMPIPVEQLYISWSIIASDEGKMQAFMVALPRHIADLLIGILHNAGLKPYMMDIKPLALARLVKENTAVIVDVQSKEFDIIIMVDGMPQPIRTVYFPEDSALIADKLSIVRDELERTAQFYDSNNPDKTLPADVPLFVSGEVIEDPEIYNTLGDELGYRVLPLASPLKYPRQLNPVHYLVNVGLVLKELRKEAGPLVTNINTLPEPYLPRQISLTKMMLLPAAGVAVIIIIMLAVSVQQAGAYNSNLHSQLDATNYILDQRQVQKKDITVSMASMEKEMAAAEVSRDAILNALNTIAQIGDILDGDLASTVNNIVDGITLRNISHNGQEVKIGGEAPGEYEISRYARNLRATGRFDKVTITSIRQLVVNASEDTGYGGWEVSENSTLYISQNSGSLEFNLTLSLPEVQ